MLKALLQSARVVGCCTCVTTPAQYIPRCQHFSHGLDGDNLPAPGSLENAFSTLSHLGAAVRYKQVPHPCCHHLLVKGYWYPLMHCSCLCSYPTRDIISLVSQLTLFTKQNKKFNTATTLKLYIGWMTPNFIHAYVNIRHNLTWNILVRSPEVSIFFWCLPTDLELSDLVRVQVFIIRGT